MEEILLYFSLKYEGDFKKIYHALQQKEKVDNHLKEQLMKKLKCSYTTIVSSDYPNCLKEINCPPFVLFYYGDLSLLNNPTIGIIGTKSPSGYGKTITDCITNRLVEKNLTIVSGMAMGIDAIAHRSAIDNQGKTIAVLETGIDLCYPKCNLDIYNILKQSHLIISEYPSEAPYYKHQFPNRDRIIAAISDKILVTEAHSKSDTLIRVGHALEQGKDVLCIPNRLNDETHGCNRLIQQGAKIVLDTNDIINI